MSANKRNGRKSNQNADTCIVVGMHGQWTDVNAIGPVLRHGSFKFPLIGDSTFQGDLLNGRRFGHGVQVYSNRYVMKRVVPLSSKIRPFSSAHQFSISQISSAARYEGEFRDGMMNGSGSRRYCDGSRYSGEWKDGLKHGRGKLVLANGDRYEGQFAAGRMHGNGRYVLTTGDEYEGDFSEGEMHGWGEYRFHAAGDGAAVYKGQMHRGAPHGRGALVVSGAGGAHQLTYAGAFADGELRGEGDLHLACGDTYHGEFAAGHFHGRGTYVYADKSRCTARPRPRILNTEFTIF
jgi:hypothetical protein